MTEENHKEHEAPKSQSPAVADVAHGWLARIFTRSESFVAGRYWLVEVLLLAVLTSVMFSAIPDRRLLVEFNGHRWYPEYYLKTEHPFRDVAKTNLPDRHEAKLNFRLTVPVVLHLLRVPPSQLWVLPALVACGSAAIIMFACLFAWRVTQDKVCGLYAALAVSCTYIGSFGFTMYYDTIAVCQLAAAMLPGVRWIFRGLLVFTAAFTDERAFLAAPLLLVQTQCAPQLRGSVRARLLLPESLAVIVAMAAYVLARLALQKFAGLTSPFDGIGWPRFFQNAPFWHAGFWMSLKGGWLLVAAASICLWHQKRRFALAGLLLTVIWIISLSFFVEDVGRSVAYAFPAFLVAIQVLGGTETIFRHRTFLLLAFLVSLATGNYNIWCNSISWFQPLAVAISAHALHLLVGWFGGL